MLRGENARLSGWVYVDVRGRDLRSVVNDMQAAGARQVAMPAGYAVSWSGQFEYLKRATERLKLVVPVTLVVIFVLYLLFRFFGDAALNMAEVPFSLVGGFWLVERSARSFRLRCDGHWVHRSGGGDRHGAAAVNAGGSGRLPAHTPPASALASCVLQHEPRRRGVVDRTSLTMAKRYGSRSTCRVHARH